MPFGDLTEFQSEHDDGLAAEALARSESPVCAEGHVADEVFECGECERYFCEKHITAYCRKCGIRTCEKCRSRHFEVSRHVCDDCIDNVTEVASGPQEAA